MEVFHNSKDEIYFSEIASRIRGIAVIGNSIKNAHNVDIYKLFVDVGLNNVNLSNLNPNGPFTGFITFPTSIGKITEISTEQDFQYIPGVKKVKLLAS